MVAALPALSTGSVTDRARQVAREVAVPVAAVALIAATAEMRLPIGVPGHRGLIWLTLLVAVALTTRVRATVITVGAASAVTVLAVQGASWQGGRYLLAAVLLYLLAGTAAVQRRRWRLALAAAPIHLVAVAVPTGLFGAAGVAAKVGGHLGFGLLAGVLGLLIAAGVGPRR